MIKTGPEGNKKLKDCAEFAWLLLSSGSPGDGPLTTVLIEIIGCGGRIEDEEERIFRFACQVMHIYIEKVFVGACS